MRTKRNGTDYHVSTRGNDLWSGRLPDPDSDGNDGPFATIARARDAVRQCKLAGGLAGPATVWVRGGRYPIDGPIVFGPDDSAPVTYAAWPGEKPVIDGGRRIEGWRIETLGSTAVWVADLPEVARGAWYFRQLFVNGERRRRPRLPKEGFYWIQDVPGTSLSADMFAGTDTFVCAPGDVRDFKNLTDAEVVVFHWWVDNRLPIASFDESTRTVRSSRTSIFALRDDDGKRYAKYYVENVFEALGEPGQWYLDRPVGKLYYVPMPGEQPETAEVFAPATEQLLVLAGEPERNRHVEFLRFEGLTFRHSQCPQPPGGREGFEESPTLAPVDYGAAAQAAYNIPGAIRLEGTRYCAIRNCRVEHVGWYGIELADGCAGNRIVGNEIGDLGAGGVRLNGSDADGPPARRTGNNVIADNHIHAGGRVFHSAVGILSVHSFGNQIAHNHVHDLYYTGISCGWVWGYTPSTSADNRIEKNHIHDIGQGVLSDMAGIYLLGVQPGTVVHGNVVHDVYAGNYGGWGIYPDQGASHLIIEQNVCYNTKHQAFHQHYGRENIVRNNVFAFGGEGLISIGKVEDCGAMTFERNILITDDQPIFVGARAGLIEKRRFISDLNLYWSTTGSELVSGNRRPDKDGKLKLAHRFTLEEMRELGYELHSIVADPRCEDLGTFKFALQDDSPAFALGFTPIDTSDVGPRPSGERGGD